MGVIFSAIEILSNIFILNIFMALITSPIGTNPTGGTGLITSPIGTNPTGGTGTVGPGIIPGSGSTATIPPIVTTPSSALGITTTPTTIPPSITGGSTGSLTYPPEMATGGDPGTVRLSFSFYKYIKGSPFDKTQFQLTGKFIFLPIPDGIVDQYTVGYHQFDPYYKTDLIRGELEIGANNVTAAEAIPGIIRRVVDANSLYGYKGDDWNALTKSIMNSVAVGSRGYNTVSTMFKTHGPYLESRLAGGLDGSTGADIVDNIFHTALNPNSTLALNAPALRSHSFSWLLAPKSWIDSDIIYNIVQEFKTHQLPDTDDTRYFLQYPDIIYPEFIGTDNYMYTFKPAVITGFSFMPVASGQPAFFNDSHAPVMIQISITIQEIMFFLKKDVPLTQQQLAAQDLQGQQSAEDVASGFDDSNVLPGTLSTNANE